MNSKSGKKRKNKPAFEKGKVYIPKYKTIFFCLCVIVVCVVLLLITTIKTGEKQTSTKNEQEITQNISDEQEKTPKASNPSAESKNSTKSKTSDETKSSAKNKASVEAKTLVENKSSVEAKTLVEASPKKSAETQQKTEKSQETVTNSQSNQTQVQQHNKNIEKNDIFGFPQAVNHAQLVFVFDDGGQNLSQLDRFLKLPFPITVAVLPRITHSKEAAQKIRESGNEVILHQPMQSINQNINPGPGAITPDMTEDQIITTLFQNITEIGPISGVNNHEGSAITADAEKMAVVLKTVNEEGLYFLDSRTNVETKVPFVAEEMGYNYYERNIFLDNTKTRENALEELKKGLNIANKNGVVIMIGHIWSAEFLPAFLEEVYPELVTKGYTFKTVSDSKAKK